MRLSNIVICTMLRLTDKFSEHFPGYRNFLDFGYFRSYQRNVWGQDGSQWLYHAFGIYSDRVSTRIVHFAFISGQSRSFMHDHVVDPACFTSNLRLYRLVHRKVSFPGLTEKMRSEKSCRIIVVSCREVHFSILLWLNSFSEFVLFSEHSD